MKILYLDNIRGFTDQYIPFENVSFLVGENSSGKSSVLSILKIINDQQFWISNKFNSDDINLGNFDDIVSGESDDKTSFTLAYTFTRPLPARPKKIKTRTKKSSNDVAIACIALTFKNFHNEPILTKLSLIQNDTIFHARISARTLYTNHSAYKPSAEWNTKSFEDFVKSHKDKKIKFEKKKIPDDIFSGGVAHQFPLFLLISLIEQLSLSKEFEFSIQAPSLDEVTWLAPIREKPRRTYDNIKKGYTPEGDHIPALLDEILNGRDAKIKQPLQNALREFGKESGLFSEISSRRYGRIASAPFELGVTLNKKAFRISSVGYGVSQVLPIIVEGFVGKRGRLLAVQQPEVHLHPKAQAALGAFFFKLAHNERKKFLIETHSDFLIDRFRITKRETAGTKVTAQVLFFSRATGRNRCDVIKINDDGSYDTPQPSGFREFFVNENLALLGLA